MGWTDQGLNSGRGKISACSQMSRSALEHIQRTWSSWDVKPDTHLHLLPTLQMSGVIPPSLYMPSWHVYRQLYPSYFLSTTPQDIMLQKRATFSTADNVKTLSTNSQENYCQWTQHTVVHLHVYYIFVINFFQGIIASKEFVEVTFLNFSYN